MVGPPAQYFSDRDIRQPMLRDLMSAKRRILFTQYQIDDQRVIGILQSKLNDKVRVKGILDLYKFKSSSCARQPQAQADLFEAGAQLKVMSPQGGAYSCLHCKTVLIDGEIGWTGSVNLTSNGFDNNFEDAVRVTDSEVIRQLTETFTRRWGEAKAVDQAMIDEAIATRANPKPKSLARGNSQPNLRLRRTKSAESDGEAVSKNLNETFRNAEETGHHE